MQKVVRFNSADYSLGQKEEPTKIRAPLMQPIYEESSNKSVTISVFSRHKLPEKGHQSTIETLKAYSTVIGGVTWMLVSL